MVLEITDARRFRSVIESAVSRLREVGFKIALDDVGAGTLAGDAAAGAVEYVKIDRGCCSARLRTRWVAQPSWQSCFARGGSAGVAEGIEDEPRWNSCAGSPTVVTTLGEHDLRRAGILLGSVRRDQPGRAPESWLLSDQIFEDARNEGQRIRGQGLLGPCYQPAQEVLCQRRSATGQC